MSNANNIKLVPSSAINWTDILLKDITFGSQYKIMPTEGYLAWEYNPLRNYRLCENMYEKDGKYYSKEEIYKTLEITTSDETTYLNNKKSLLLELVKSPQNKQEIDRLTELVDDFENKFNSYTLREAGELVDFITDELSFSLLHPVDILPQPSYDGSVNLIINDGLNIPRLINSRFTALGKNTYKIVDRKGDNDTNIYDLGTLFDIDTSLFKNVSKIPKLEYLGTSSGNMKIGNYHFYFKYVDADGNESDWVAESGLVSVFIGTTPTSVNTGIRDENSIKSVHFKLSNIDTSYSYVTVYYTRYSSDIDGNYTVSAKQLSKNFIVNNSGICYINITGDENEIDVTLEEINSSFDTIQNAQTHCIALNRLFMANIHKTKVEYDLLSKLSLCFCPYKVDEAYPLANDGINENYTINSTEDGYYNSKYIYNKTGYWPDDLYRFGIVYILKDGSLSPVFNIRGATNIPSKNPNQPFYSVESSLQIKDLDEVIASIDYSEEDYMIVGGSAPNENAKGVVSFSSEYSTNPEPFSIIGINITANAKVILRLLDYVKGFFFVRLKRMPLTLCLGITVGVDKESRTPTIPTTLDIINNINTENSFVESENIDGTNFISEGFLGRYYYKLEKKDTGFWKKLGTALGVVAVLAAAAVAIVFTCGTASAVVGAGIVAAVAEGAAAVGAAATAITISSVVTAAVATFAVGVLHDVLVNRASENEGKVRQIKGRDEPIPDGWERSERSTSRYLTLDITDRYIVTGPSKNKCEAIIVPDYLVNQPYYNLFLTGELFVVKLTHEQPLTSFLNSGHFPSSLRHFYATNYQMLNDSSHCLVKLVGVPDGCPIKMIDDLKFRARAGYPEEAYKYEFVGRSFEDSSDKKANSDIIRGNYGSYIGMLGYKGHAVDQLNIMIPGYLENKLFDYILLRALDTSAFYAISDRFDINEYGTTKLFLLESTVEYDFSETMFRGDCYICQYTHRIIRNFNDPSAPYNDVIVDEKTWKNNYNPDKPENYAKINLGDVNAILLGLWLTFKLRSSYNLNIRTIDKSNVDEYLMCGNYRSFYPNYGQLADGNLKIPDSNLYNKGFSKSVSEKYYFEVPHVPYIKLEFLNRIVFSDIHINDAYKNGFRVLRTTNHKDLPGTYGSITKLVELLNNLLVVFEHGIGIITINNTAEHSSKILSDIVMISDVYGSQWKDSIIKTPSGIYGVDTVGRKIWRVRSGQLELISDLKVLEFLNQNISLTERELTPIIGIRNVKTVYNAFKHDIMFTFYDNTYGILEKSWNLCWNELLGIFTTFYSWIPGEMENIDNIPFSFDRSTVKNISKLGVSNHYSDFADGITLSNNIIPIISESTVENDELTQFQVKLGPTNPVCNFTFVDKLGNIQNYKFSEKPNDEDDSVYLLDILEDPRFVGFLHLNNRTLPDDKVIYKITYLLLHDRLNNRDLFEIVNTKVKVEQVNTIASDSVDTMYISYLRIKDDTKISDLLSELYYRNKAGISYADGLDNRITPYEQSDGESTIFIPRIDLPIFKNKSGKREMLPDSLLINADKIVRYLNVKASIQILGSKESNSSLEAYYNLFVSDSDRSLIDAGYYLSLIAITTSPNLKLISTDFWKHGLAGIIDITDKIFPTLWYGKQHPFEFECVVYDNNTMHKIFTNLEIVSNKVKPESFHYEIMGDAYDFADDKPTMYFRLEALKALYQYNGYNIEYNPNFLEIEPKLHRKSADLPKYYSRWDTVNEIYDSYKRFASPAGFSYDHLAGAEIVYYPTRNEFRVCNHAQAIDMDELSLDIATSIIKANCRYLEDRWLVAINPIIVTYKNEFDLNKANNAGKSIFSLNGDEYEFSTWAESAKGSYKLPLINILGTKLEEKLGTAIKFPGADDKDNALCDLYDLEAWKYGDWRPIDPSPLKERRETDVRGKFMKVRIRYTGNELVIIDFLNTLYQMSFA